MAILYKIKPDLAIKTYSCYNCKNMNERIRGVESFNRQVQTGVGDFLKSYGLKEDIVKRSVASMGGLAVNDPGARWLKGLALPAAGSVTFIETSDRNLVSYHRYRTEIDGSNVLYNELSIKDKKAPIVNLTSDGKIYTGQIKVEIVTKDNSGTEGPSITFAYMANKLKKKLLKEMKPGRDEKPFQVTSSVFVDLPYQVREELADGDQRILSSLPNSILIIFDAKPVGLRKSK